MRSRMTIKQIARTPPMLGQFIKERRLALDLTQEYLAKRLGISRPTYRKLENGQREPSFSETEKLAAEFGMTLEDLQTRKTPQHDLPAERPVRKRAGLHIRVRKRNLAKFRQVLLYVLDRVGGKPHVGETVLHKLLYFIDFDYYEKFEENLTGVTYIRNHYGPTVQGLGDILQHMQKQKLLVAVKNRYFAHTQKKYLPLVPPDLSILSAREIKHIDGVLAHLADKNARDLETYSHGDMPWRATAHGKAISYELVFYRNEKYSVRDYDEL